MKRMMLVGLLLLVPGFALGMSVGAFIDAAYEGNEIVVRQFLENEGDVNATMRYDSYGESALHAAAWNGNCNIVKLLLDHGAQINLTNTSGSTALHYAVMKRFTAEGTVFHFAQTARIRAVVTLLCERGDIRPSLTAVDGAGYTPQMIAEANGLYEAAQIIEATRSRLSLTKGIPTENNSSHNG